MMTRITRGGAARFSLVGGVRGLLAACGMTVTLTATAQVQPSPQRAAVLLPPQALSTTDQPAIARGAIDDVPKAFATPVAKPTARPTPPATSTGPTWLTIDPNVQPASGIGPSAPNPAAVKPTPAVVKPAPAPAPSRIVPPAPRDDSFRITKPIDKPQLQSAPERLPPTEPADTALTPNATTPFRATTTSGAPVYAGPPAYRWYGYGSVTPGANPYAPTGQYPKASANWYSVTGATPGAFPVPVMNPLRAPAGAEPPTYAAVPTTRYPGPVAAAVPAPAVPPSHRLPDQPPAPVVDPMNTKFEPLPPTTTEPPRLGSASPAVSPGVAPIAPVPVSTPAPPEAPLVPAPQSTFQPAPVIVPTISPPPSIDGPLAPPMPQSIAPLPNDSPATSDVPPPAGVVPSVAPPSEGPVAPQMPAAPPPQPAMNPMPVPTPTNLKLPVFPPPGAPGDVRWQPGEAPLVPEGTWTPSPGTSRSSQSRAPIVRGQIADSPAQADPLGDLIRSICRGRATGVEVRWTGEKKLTVCFESASQAEATRLVQDISGRPELVPIQIDFCVLVK